MLCGGIRMRYASINKCVTLFICAYMNQFPLFHPACSLSFLSSQLSSYFICCKCKNNIPIIHVEARYKTQITLTQQTENLETIWPMRWLHTERHILKVKIGKTCPPSFVATEKQINENRNEKRLAQHALCTRISDMRLNIHDPIKKRQEKNANKKARRNAHIIKMNKPKIRTNRNVCLILFQHEIYIAFIFTLILYTFDIHLNLDDYRYHCYVL